MRREHPINNLPCLDAAQVRISPFPNTTYFSDVSPSIRTGPRVWNLSVLMRENVFMPM